MKKIRQLLLRNPGKVRDTLTGWDFTIDPALRPMKAMRAKCIDCCGGQPAEVTRCAITDCPLWPYRAGRRPKRAADPGKVLVKASLC
ncbi:MAG TPA: hypothetical protein PKI11_04735 [Candidatus Hydrogenedentes bacterium]|nr:hypothetical protein [Candidatus Hydrogenedentota bacterium]HNT89594.1 hypothetical protein [Candidatus Hydrogenedentota bacterium]